MKKMYFYHSFPNPDYCGDEETMKVQGIKIIDSMLKIGFLLTPEPIEWSKYFGEKNLGTVNQKRFCFTYLEPIELDEHCDRYGMFSLQFNNEAIRYLGALPVFYMPSVKSPNYELIYPSQFLVKTLLYLNAVLKDPNFIYGVKGVLGLLCPTEHKEQESLENFRLREWRITGNTLRLFEAQKRVVAAENAYSDETGH